YLHVPDMVAEGWAQFHRDLRREMTLEALVVDWPVVSVKHNFDMYGPKQVETLVKVPRALVCSSL
ncbi:hypothetical protein AB0395_31115, partial [Streptosporangium sp. NPDC051023]|uniref:hypothetical protein n=1 Tax=Streptosporangium sp. NPDC051023 TaxID=3155410 RepID=UPI00344C685D